MGGGWMVVVCVYLDGLLCLRTTCLQLRSSYSQSLVLHAMGN